MKNWTTTLALSCLVLCGCKLPGMGVPGAKNSGAQGSSSNIVKTFALSFGSTSHGAAPRIASMAMTASPLITNAVPLSQIAHANQDLDIPVGMNAIIDQSVDLGALTIEGTLTCPQSGNFTLSTQGIVVSGSGGFFECGNESKRFTGNLKIALKPGKTLIGSERSVVALNQGVLRLVGDGKHAGWRKLTVTAAAGSSVINVDSPVDWNVGDQIAIAPTGFDPHEAELMTVSSVSLSGKTVTFTSPLQHSHWGGIQNFSIGSNQWALDESAEVADLTRNIQIYGAGDLASLNYLGGHVMIMKSAQGYINGVEFYRMGRMGEMMRYPFHWHRGEDVSGQYIVNSSIHQSFQRCVTVHGSNNALVQNNVCYDHFSHGFFLEDGNETGNVIDSNLGILSRRPPQGRNLLFSDTDVTQLMRWAGPATFWISNPNNTVTNNISAGSEGSGFWNAFVDNMACDEHSCTVHGDNPNVLPSSTATLKFESNTSRANIVGMAWDGAPAGALTGNPNNPKDRATAAVHYGSPVDPEFKNLLIAKSSIAGLYYRGNSAKFENSIFADNAISLFFAYNQQVTHSAIIAFSQNHSDADMNYLAVARADISYPTFMSGVLLYDGAFELHQVDFIGFPSTPVVYNGEVMTPVPFRTVGGAARYTDIVEGLQFSPEPEHRYTFNRDNWMDSPYSTSMRDLDGSLTGTPNTLMVEDDPFNNDSSCKHNAGAQAYECHYDQGVVFLGSSPTNRFQVTRNDGVSTLDPVTIGNDGLFAKFGVIIGKSYQYEVDYLNTQTFPIGVSFLPSGSENYPQSKLSPVLKFAKLGSGCSVPELSEVSSLAQLRAASNPSFYQDQTNVFMVLRQGSTGNISCSGAPVVPKIMGLIEGVSGTPASSFVSGWACIPGAPASINVHLYLGGPAGSGTFIGQYPANLGSESAVNWDQCVSPKGTAYRFSIPLPSQYSGQKIFIHGINGAENGLLMNSGSFAVPGGSRHVETYTTQSSVVFDANWYLQTYPDLMAAFGAGNVSAATSHWLNTGINEGRQGNWNFSPSEYLAMYPDLVAAFGANNYQAALSHFVHTGLNEGRAGRYGLRSEIFDPNYYLQTYPDLMKAFGAGNVSAASQHWLNNGIKEGRRGSPNFSPVNYLNHYPDLISAFGSGNYLAAVTHYFQFGIREGRSGN